MTADRALGNLRVVELGHYIAAPYAATIFADQGAEVVKIERPEGDPYRSQRNRFAAWNRGKKSLTLDLKLPEGLAEARELIARADVLIENLRPGALSRLGLDPQSLRSEHPELVTCSISAYGSAGPASQEPGWEPLVNARAGALQGPISGERPVWLPFPLASVGAALLAVLGTSAALIRRETTGYGQHVETSLLDALLFLNAGPIFHRSGHTPRPIRRSRSPILHIYETADGAGMQVNFSGTERWLELRRLLGLEGDGGLDFSNPATLGRLSDRAWRDQMFDELAQRFASRTADEWEERLLGMPAATSKCRTLAEWLDHEQVKTAGLLIRSDDHELGCPDLVGPPIRLHLHGRSHSNRRPRSVGSGALSGVRVVDIASFWAGPLAARLLAELGAEVVKVEPPGGEGGYQLMPILPNIYVDANRSKRGLTLDVRDDEDRQRLLDLVATSDVVVENAVAGTWERLGLGEDELRKINPELVYARAKGFGIRGPLADRPSFDYVVQAATGMEMIQGGGQPQPVNFTANDYGTGIHLAAGAALALLARTRGGAGITIEASLMTTATVFESEHVATVGSGSTDSRAVGDDLSGPEPWCRLYEAEGGWIVICAVTTTAREELLDILGIGELSNEAVAGVVGRMPVDEVIRLLRDRGVPVARCLNPSAVPEDPQVRARRLLVTTRHSVAGPFTQVGIPLHLSADVPAVKGPAPAPARRIRIRRGDS